MTTRRDALKLGALAATPVAALAPTAAFATDESAARLAMLEDERAITRLVTDFIRRFNGGGDWGEFVAASNAISIDPEIGRILDHTSSEPTLSIAADGTSVSWQSATHVELTTDFEGDSTLEKMARFQGQGSAQSIAPRRLDVSFTRSSHGWTITHLTLA